MKIYDELGEVCLASNLKDDYVFSCGGGNCFAFSGNYKMERFLDNEIIINLSKKRHIVVLGEGLKIGTLAPKELGISGKISSIKIEEE